MNINHILILLLISISALQAQDLTPYWNSETDKNGYMDSRERIIIKPIYDGNSDFSEGLAGVSISGKWGFIDATGIKVITLQYDSVASF